MAEDAEQKEGETQAPSPSKQGRSKLVIIIIGVAVVCVLGGIAAFFLLRERNVDVQEIGEDLGMNEGMLPSATVLDEEELQEGEEVLGAFFPLDPLVVNLKGGGFLRVQMQFEFTQRDIPASFIARNVIIRDGVISLLAARNKEDVLSLQGRDEIKNSIKELIQKTLRKEIIKKVYFTQFVVQ